MLGTNTVLVGVMAAALIPLIVGEFDLSVGAVSGLAAMITAVLNGQHHWPVLVAALVAVLAAGAVGVVNALFVVLLDNDSFIVTLGVGTAVTGAVYWMSALRDGRRHISDALQLGIRQEPARDPARVLLTASG